jgi:hypothetical protein
MRRLLILVSLVLALFLFMSTLAFGIGGSSSGGGSSAGGARSSAPSSAPSSRPSSSPSASAPKSSSSSSSSAPKSGSGGVRPSSPSQPSSGRIAQPAPAARLVPRALPPNVRTPAGRNFARDRAALSRNPRYLDPYNSAYYGNPQSPFFYMYLAELNNNNGPRPVAYQAPQCKPKHKGISGVAATFIALGTLLVGLLFGFLAGRSSAPSRGGW